MQLDFQKSPFLEHSAELLLLGTMKHSNMLVLPKQNFVTEKKMNTSYSNKLGPGSLKRLAGGAWQAQKALFHESAAQELAQTYLQLPLRQWGAGIVYLLVLSS